MVKGAEMHFNNRVTKGIKNFNRRMKMKGLFKKLAVGFMVSAMVLTSSLPVMAESITITNQNNNEGDIAKIDYTYYQIMKADILSVTNNGADQSGTAAYYVESEALADLISKTGLFKVEKVSSGDRWNVTLVYEGEDAAAKIVEAFDKDAIKNAVTVTGVFDNIGADGKAQKTATKDGLDAGYYLVLSSLGTKAAIQTLGNVTINEKNTYPTVQKTDDKDYDSMFDFDKPINYTISVNIPANVAEKDIEVYDKASVGITIDTSDKAVEAYLGGTKVDDYTWTKVDEKSDAQYNVYKLVIKAENVVKCKGQTVEFKYKGTINDKAVVLVPEKNTAYIQYDNYTSSETEPVEVETLGFKLLKIDGANKKPISGAEFTLWDADNNGNQIKVVACEAVVSGNKIPAYRVAKDGETGVNIAVDSNGEAFIVGLDAKTYWLQEEVAPTGYNKLVSRVSVTINTKDINNQVIDHLETTIVENNQGSVLPSTGGIGTTIFYLVGGFLIVAGLAWFIVRRRVEE